MRPQARPGDVADERRDQPQPAVQAARGDAAEVGADVAAVGDARAVAEQQCRRSPPRPASGPRPSTPARTCPARIAASSAPRMMPKSITDVTSISTLDLQRRRLRRRRPVGPRRDVDAERGEPLRAPQRERGGDAPRPAADRQRRDVDEREADGAGDQRPRSRQPARSACGLRFVDELAVTLPLSDHRDPRDARRTPPG